jgi:PDZ domain-containing secreted protein
LHDYRSKIDGKDRSPVKLSKGRILSVVLPVFLMFAGVQTLWAVEKMTITGTVNEDSQIVTVDGTVYEVLEGGKGVEVFDKVGKTVKVTGEVEELDGDFLINVLSCEVVEQKK